MITIKVHTPIASEDEGIFYSMFGIDNAVFSLESCRRIFDDNPDETDFRFDLHCPGGSVPEGLAIYDYLRTSGKSIYMNIEGGCHSMAVTLLLAAPKDKRTANPNCRAMIHKVYGGCGGGTADELEAAAKNIRQYQDSILDIYADRTDMSRKQLEAIMNEEKERTARELLEWGFISKINTYNTNFKSKNLIMNLKELKQKANNFLNGIKEVLGAMNFDFVDAEGEVLFSTEGEDDAIEVGMAATPDGVFTIADGRTVTIEEGVITEIEDPEPEPTTDEEVENLKNEVKNLRTQLAEAADIIREYKKTRSNYTPNGRVGNLSGGNKGRGAKTAEERKNEVREKMGKNK